MTLLHWDYKEGVKTGELRLGRQGHYRQRHGCRVVKEAGGRDVVPSCCRLSRARCVQHLLSRVNVGGAKIVLDAVAAGVKRSSTAAPAGAGNVKIPRQRRRADCRSRLLPTNQVRGRTLVHEYQQQGLKTVIVRPAAIYGPGDPERFGMIFGGWPKAVSSLARKPLLSALHRQLRGRA